MCVHIAVYVNDKEVINLRCNGGTREEFGRSGGENEGNTVLMQAFLKNKLKRKQQLNLRE